MARPSRGSRGHPGHDESASPAADLTFHLHVLGLTQLLLARFLLLLLLLVVHVGRGLGLACGRRPGLRARQAGGCEPRRRRRRRGGLLLLLPRVVGGGPGAARGGRRRRRRQGDAHVLARDSPNLGAEEGVRPAGRAGRPPRSLRPPLPPPPPQGPPPAAGAGAAGPRAGRGRRAAGRGPRSQPRLGPGAEDWRPGGPRRACGPGCRLRRRLLRLRGRATGRPRSGRCGLPLLGVVVGAPAADAAPGDSVRLGSLSKWRRREMSHPHGGRERGERDEGGRRAEREAEREAEQGAARPPPPRSARPPLRCGYARRAAGPPRWSRAPRSPHDGPRVASPWEPGPTQNLRLVAFLPPLAGPSFLPGRVRGKT